MTRDVLVVAPKHSVANAWLLLQRENIRHLPVVDHGNLVGILSDRDFLRLGDVLPSGELHFVDRAVTDIMTLRPIVCSPNTSVSAATKIMTEEKIDCLPVVSGDRLVGLVTSTDLLRLLIDFEEPQESLPFAFRLRELPEMAVALV